MRGQACEGENKVSYPRATEISLFQILPGSESQQGMAARSQEGAASASPVRAGVGAQGEQLLMRFCVLTLRMAPVSLPIFCLSLVDKIPH